MAGSLGIKWYGSTNKGVQEAAHALAEVLALAGKHVQAFSQSDPPLCPFPTVASNRVSDTPIKNHSELIIAQVAVVLDARLLKIADIREEIGRQKLLIIDTPLDPALIKEKLNLSGNRVLCLDVGDCTLPYIPLFMLLVDRFGIVPMEVFKKSLETFLSTRVKAEPLAERLKNIGQALREVREA